MKLLSFALAALVAAFSAVATVPVRFEGSRAYSPEDLSRSLSLNLEYALAEANASPIGLAPVVQRLLREGYRHAGYADVRITSDLDAQGIMVSIDEGARSLCGDVRVEGALSARDATILHDTLLADPADAEVTNAFARLEGWSATDGVPFNEAYLVQVCRTVSNACLLRFGSAPAFAATLARRPAEARADLVIHFAEPATPRIAGTIEVLGAVTNTPAEVLAWLKLETGQPIGAGRVADLVARLRDSGRFIDNAILVGPPGTNGQSAVTVRLLEAPTIPPLNAELPPAAETLLRAVAWMDGWKTNEAEMSIRFKLSALGDDLPPWTLDVLASPRSGFALQVTDPHGPATGALFSAYAFAGREVLFHSGRSGHSYTLPTPGASVVFQFEIGAHTPDAEGRWRALNSGVFFGSSNGAPIQIKARLHPAAMVSIACSTNAPPRLENGIYTFSLGPEIALRVEAASGRPVSFESVGRGRIDFVTGAFERTVADIRAAAGTNVRVADRPLASFVGFAGPELLRIPGLETSLLARVAVEKRPAFLSAAGKLVQAAADAPWDRLLSDLTGGTNRLFIPADASRLPPSASGPLAFLAPYLLADAGRIAPDSSWVAALVRAEANSFCGLGKPFGAVMEAIAKSEESGPLSLGACAFMTRTLSPRFSQQVAHLATERSTPADFRRDLEPLRDRTKLLGDLLQRTTSALAALEPAEADALAEALPEAHRAAFVRFVAALRKAPREELPVAALADYWSDDLRSLYLESLRPLLPH